MTICEYCEKEMKEVDDCSWNRTVEFPDGIILPSITYHPDDLDTLCHDCGVKHGCYHHPGCDMERCPRCGGQLISCGCLDEEDEQE